MTVKISKRRNYLIYITVLLAGIFFTGNAAEKSVKIKETSAVAAKTDKIFVIHAPISDLNEFRELASQAARLKPYGRVEVNVSNLADKGFHEIGRAHV